MTVQEQLRALIERHVANLGEQLSTVADLLTPSGAMLPVAQADEAEGIMHQLKGTAGSMGFPEVGAVAAELDEHLKVLKNSPEAIPAAKLQPTLDLLAKLKRLSESTTPEMSTLYNADLSRLG